jgi:hypothetical protein
MAYDLFTIQIWYSNSVACTINILELSNDASRIIIDDYWVMLQIVVSLADDSRGVIYNPRGISDI